MPAGRAAAGDGNPSSIRSVMAGPYRGPPRVPSRQLNPRCREGRREAGGGRSRAGPAAQPLTLSALRLPRCAGAGPAGGGGGRRSAGGCALPAPPCPCPQSARPQRRRLSAPRTAPAPVSPRANGLRPPQREPPRHPPRCGSHAGESRRPAVPAVLFGAVCSPPPPAAHFQTLLLALKEKTWFPQFRNDQ